MVAMTDRSVRLLCVFLFSILCLTNAGRRQKQNTRRQDLPTANDPPAINPQAGVCPCVRPKSGGGCIAYNSRYQAATLEEAVINFVDPLASDPSMALNLFYQRPNYANDQPSSTQSNQCSTLECVACVQAVTELIIQQLGPVESAKWGIAPQPANPQWTTSAPLARYCRRVQQGQTTPMPNAVQQPKGGAGHPSRNDIPPPGARNGQPKPAQGGNNGPQPGGNQATFPEDQAWWIIGDLAFRPTTASPNHSANSGNWSSGNSNDTEHWNHTVGVKTPPRRQKRASPPGSAPGGRLGVSTPLDCSYRKGTKLDDNSGYVGLCSLCWSLRTLSHKYFPRYINEVSCSKKDNKCLSGYGKCRERYRSVDVLYNAGTDSSPKWRQYSINSPVACECQLLSGSALHNFVSH